jgi:Putative restriction endonuclease
MSALLTKPAPFHGARPVRWSVAGFHRAREAGQLEGERTFLLRGILMEQGPMNPPHALTCELLQSFLPTVFGSGWRIRSQLPLVLNLYTDPLPDFAILEGNIRNVGMKHPKTAALVIEVSDTTINIDTGEKAALYAAAGIADYWVLDITERRLLVHRDPDPAAEKYHSITTVKEVETISPLAVPEKLVRVGEMLV